MELLCDQALESLDHTAQKDKGELAQRGKLGKRRRPSRASLKAQLSTAVIEDEDAVQITSDKRLKDEELNHHDQVNGDLISTVEVSYDDNSIIKQGPKGTVIEIGNTRIPDATTVIRINYPMEENSAHTGAVVTGAILKSPEKRLSEMTGGTAADPNNTEPEVDESEDEEAECKRWKSLPSLWQATAKCKEINKEETEEEEAAPWAHEVKLRHVEDPESAQRGCSMLFFGPLPKSQQSPTGGRRDTASSGNDSQLPDTQHNGTDVIYRPIRPRPASVCDQVQIQTWDRRHLTSSSRTNLNDALQKFGSTSNLGSDGSLVTDVGSSDKPTAGLKEERKAATYKRTKPKKRWKLDVMDKGVQRSKSLNGIDKTDQPEWIELSRRLTSRNIDWDNLPTTKNGNTGKNLQSELKLAWKIKGTQEKAESNTREDGKDEIILRKEDLASIPNGLIKPKPAARWEKLDSNANLSQHQKSTLSHYNHNSSECQRGRTLPQQPSAQEEAILWIKEAEKRRQKYMDWQSQETAKSPEEVPNKESPKVPKETLARHVSTLPETALNKTIPSKLLNSEQLEPLPVKEESAPNSKKEDKIKDAFRQELSLFSVKLRRVRCAKPEECFHEVKCQPTSEEDHSPPPEPKVISVPTVTQPPVPSPRTKKPSKSDPEITHKDTEKKPTEDPPPRDTFCVQVSEQESDDFFIVINDQEDDSFLQIKPPKDMQFDKSSSIAPKTDQAAKNDSRWSVKSANEHFDTKVLTEMTNAPTTNENGEVKISLTNDSSNIDMSETDKQSTNEHNETANQCNDTENQNDVVAMGTPINVHLDPIPETDNFGEIENMFSNLSCKEQPESMLHIDLNANESEKHGPETQKIYSLVSEDIEKDNSQFTNCHDGITNSEDTSRLNGNVVDQDDMEEPLYGKIQKVPNGVVSHSNNYLNLNGHRHNRKSETPEEKAARMTSEICGVLSSLGNRKTEAEKLALHMDILTTLTCPNAVCSKNASARAMTFVTCNGDDVRHPQVIGPQSVGVQTNGIEIHDAKIPEKGLKKSQTRIKKKTVKIIIHECDDDDDKQEVVEEIVEEILEPRTQKGRMVKTPPTISRTIAEAEDGSTYLTTTVVDNCVFRPEDTT